MRNLFFATFISLCLFSCQSDSSEEMASFATAKEEPCDCYEGFQGYNCDVRILDRFLGTYNRGQTDCDQGGTSMRTHRITAVPGSRTEIFIDNGIYRSPLRAVVSGWGFDIPEQSNSFIEFVSGRQKSFMVYGQGWIDSESNKLYYKLNGESCVFELEFANQRYI